MDGGASRRRRGGDVVKDCRRASAAIIEVVRGTASEAARLLLDEHLGGCARCREERAQWTLLERLKDTPVPQLAPEARARITRHLRLSHSGAMGRARPLLRRWQGLAAGLAVLAVAAGVTLGGWARRHASSSPDAVAAEDDLTPTALFRGEGPGELTSLGGVKIAYEAGTTLRLPRSSRGRVVELLAGRVDVDVTPKDAHEKGAIPFQVRTATFVVEVLGTRFIVTADEVHTLRGLVRVQDLAGRELATLGAGKVWQRVSSASLLTPSPSPTPLAATAPLLTTSTPTKPVGPSKTAAGPAKPYGHRAKTTAETLAEARAILGSGDAKRARKLLSGLVAQGGHGRQQAMAALLTSDSYLIEGRRDEALAGYRRTTVRYAGTPEAETAEFAAAELLVEQGARPEARHALEAYLARHPQGHFAREARERLGSFGGP